MEFESVIGLEVHVQLNTKTKIFCGCSTKFGSEPNTNICPLCLGMPGVLPVLNENVLKKAIRAGLALNCDIAHHSKFDRKNYFYPDCPKAYQISQFDKPICEHGYIMVKDANKEPKKIGLTRIHMEEDAGKLIHSDDPTNPISFVDFNRTGVPLIEIVSEPDMRTADEAYQYLQNLRSIIRWIGVSDCNMEEGSLRCDVNISLRPKGQEKFGTRAEIKNLNSFKAVKASIEYEFERQEDLILNGEKVVQETRLWDDTKKVTSSMRGKEQANDYRYFPEPDLPPIDIDDNYINVIKDKMPELPVPRAKRFVEELGIPEYDADVLTSSRHLADYFEEVVKAGASAKRASNWIMSELLALVEDHDKIMEFIVTPQALAKLLTLVEKKVINGKIAKNVFEEMTKNGGDPEKIVEEKGLKQVSDTGAIETMIDKVVEANPQSVTDYKNGKDKAIKYLVGQVMKESRGKANPQMVNEILLKKLS